LERVKEGRTHMCRGGRRGRDGRAGGAGANQDLRGGVGVAAPTGRPSGRGVAEAELATGMKGRRGGGAQTRRRSGGSSWRRRRQGDAAFYPRRGSDARPLEVGTVGPVENSRIGSDIPFWWASKSRGDLARGQVPRGLSAPGKGRVPGGIPGFQTSP